MGDRPARVSHYCGAPLSAGHWVQHWRNKITILDVWHYQQRGSLLRVLFFQDGVLVSLAATSPG
ncbi:MAG TPA: hypothetical protein VFK05_20470 [Polyangiaceae bacterium]|nr:hypothetical protein [Polyangiaceae bacterium]